MRVVVTMVLLLGPLVAAGWSPSADADADAVDWCAQTAGEVPVGAGFPFALPFPLLAGVSYVDVPFHACSGGGYWLDENSENVQATRLCSQEVVRVWSLAGEAAQNYIINWKPAGTDDC